LRQGKEETGSGKGRGGKQGEGKREGTEGKGEVGELAPYSWGIDAPGHQ